MDNDNIKDCIIQRNTENGYEIYIIENNQKRKLEDKEKRIMHRILKKFPYRETQNGNYLYTNFKLINLYFEREKLKPPPKKVNRNKSKTIIPSVILSASLIIGVAAGAYNIHNHIKNTDKEQTSINIETQITNTPNIDDDNNEIIEEINAKIPQEVDFIEKEPNVFYYEYDTPGDKEAFENATQYMDVFKKYERIYGIDANLLCAIAAQESSGIHRSYSQNGHATGLMQIEDIWADAEFRVFNFEKNDYETIKVDYSKIGNLDYNVKMGAAIFRWTVDNCQKKYPYLEEKLALYTQCYNYGDGFTKQAIENAKEIPNGTWMDGREYVRAGDSKYFEHVLSRIPNNTNIKIKLPDGSNIETTLINTYLENTHSRAH